MRPAGPVCQQPTLCAAHPRPGFCGGKLERRAGEGVDPSQHHPCGAGRGAGAISFGQGCPRPLDGILVGHSGGGEAPLVRLHPRKSGGGHKRAGGAEAGLPPGRYGRGTGEARVPRLGRLDQGDERPGIDRLLRRHGETVRAAGRAGVDGAAFVVADGEKGLADHGF